MPANKTRSAAPAGPSKKAAPKAATKPTRSTRKAVKPASPVAPAKTKKTTTASKAKPIPAPAPPKPEPTLADIPHHEVEVRAYLISERRQAMGWPGDSSTDWSDAESQLLAEARRRHRLSN
jgi:hypothetical protein